MNILGTSIDSIDIAEDRDLFRHMMEKLEIPMPESGMAINFDEAKACADKIGYPIMMPKPRERRCIINFLLRKRRACPTY